MKRIDRFRQAMAEAADEGDAAKAAAAFLADYMDSGAFGGDIFTDFDESGRYFTLDTWEH